MDERKPDENQLDGLDSGIISSIEHSPPIRQHFAVEQGVILMISKAGLSETLMWRARAGQARRVASMLSPRDAALVGGPPSFLIDATLGHRRRCARYRGTDQDQLQIQIKDLRLSGNYSSRQPPESSDCSYR